MRQVIALCVGLVALPSPCWSGESPGAKETVVRLRVEPAPAAKPRLRNLLLPELRELEPGNPILGYLKCFMEQDHFFNSKEAREERDKLDALPLKELASKKITNYGSVALDRAEYAARLDTPDWQTLLKLRSDGYYLLVPEIQKMRSLSWTLKVRFRARVAERDFDKSLATAKTMFALARHTGEHPTVIGSLVGIAIAFEAIGPLEEMLGQPGCPNLYWAIADLPRPFIDLHKGMEGDRAMTSEDLDRVSSNAPMTESELQQVLNRVEKIFPAIGRARAPKVSDHDWLRLKASDKSEVNAAQERLVKQGLDAKLVNKLPGLQVILLDGKLTYEILRDEIMAGASLPYWQAAPVIAAAEEHRKDISTKQRFAELVPRLAKVRQAQARLEQRLDLLACVEALRLYAAEHGGNFPAQLADVRLPLPVDPFTGRSFLYKLEGGTAILRGTPPAGQENNPGYNVSYEVTSRRGQ
jgi:hypothetical protein